MIHLNKGKPFPLGSSLTSQGINFSLVATNAEYVEILLLLIITMKKKYYLIHVQGVLPDGEVIKEKMH